MKVLLGGFAVLTTVGSLAACEPAPPPRVFVVNSHEIGEDADPGDGICEVTPGEGDCTLLAALGEADLPGSVGVVVLPEADEPYHPILWEVRHHVRLEAQGDHASVEALALEVLPGARAEVDSIQPIEVSMINVGGTFTADRTSLEAIDVTSGGTAILLNTFVSGEGISNRGTVHLLYSTVLAAHGPFIDNRDGTLGAIASSFTTPGGSSASYPICEGGAMTSGGFNVFTDASCGPIGPTDRLADPTGEGEAFPAEGSARIDVVPVGVAGCGHEISFDIRGSTRPTDGDDDGIAACDAGAWER